MNYGYAPVSSSNGSVSHAIGDENAFGTALYNRVVSSTNLAGKDVLEVGCGRGGGTTHIFDAHAPHSMVGVDLTPDAIRHCRDRFARPGLRFLIADAEDLPFVDGSFDVVLNVESCHCYPNVPRFLEEAHRVLRPGGLLLLADVRHTRLAPADAGGALRREDVADFRGQVQASPFALLEEEDLTPNVTRALQLDSARRRAVVESRVPKLLQPQALSFAAVEGTPLYNAYVGGDLSYLRMVLQKGAGL